MIESKIWAFFYGGFINLHILKELGVELAEYEVAQLSGYDIQILPVVNLVKSDKDSVYGIVTPITHKDLEQLIKGLTEKYLPEAVVVRTYDEKWRPALCYIANSMEPRPASDNYIDNIVKPAKEFGFPLWYIEKLETFRPFRSYKTNLDTP